MHTADEHPRPQAQQEFYSSRQVPGRATTEKQCDSGPPKNPESFWEQISKHRVCICPKLHMRVSFLTESVDIDRGPESSGGGRDELTRGPLKVVGQNHKG